MIKERMIELLLLEQIVQYTKPELEILTFNGKQYDNKRICERFTELLEEFLDPYVIISDSKE